MAEAKFFSHVDPKRGDLQKRLKTAGIEWTAIAENIYQQRGYDDPVGRAVAAWLDSEGHRRNLLNPTYTDSGVGVATPADGTFYCTQIFLVPAKNGAGSILPRGTGSEVEFGAELNLA